MKYPFENKFWNKYSSKNRSGAIDFLRGLAVILVLFRHSFNLEDNVWIGFLVQGGWSGVDMFFVLSGFLVALLLFKEYKKTNKIKPFNFILRRGFKIYPLFYTAILLSLFLELNLKKSINTRDFLSEAFFVQNYFGRFWYHTWTLAIEEHFYIILAFMFFLFVKIKINSKKKVFLFLSGFTLLLCLALRGANYYLNDYSNPTHLYPTHLRLDSLLFGVVLSYLFFTENKKFTDFFRKYSLILLPVAIGLISPAFILELDNFFMNTFGLTFLYMGYGIILSVLISNNNIFENIKKIFGKVLINAVVLVGFYSYGIYLYHMFIQRYFVSFLHQNNLVFDVKIEFVSYFILSIVLGVFMSEIIEQPFLRYRDSLPKKLSRFKYSASLANLLNRK